MQSILPTLMTDSVVRGCLLRLLYERRSEAFVPFGRAQDGVPPPAGINEGDWLRAVAQLSDCGVIEWSPVEDQSGMGQLSGFARINHFGVKLVEAGVEPPIPISIDESRGTSLTRQQQAPIISSTAQQGALTEALEKVIEAINQADASEQEKNQTRSLLRKLLGSRVARDVLGPGAELLAAKYLKH